MNKSKRKTAPAQGEDNALQGFIGQYEIASELVIKSLGNDNFEKVVFKNRDAGAIDDVLIFSSKRIDAYQIKWHLPPSNLTQSDLISGSDALITIMAEGWSQLKDRHPERQILVHLYTTKIASTSPLKDVPETSPPPRHLAEFIGAYWRCEKISEEVRKKWLKFIERLQDSTKLNSEQFEEFRQVSHFHLGRRPPHQREEYSPSKPYYKDVKNLAEKLLGLSGRTRGEVTLTRAEILDLMSWHERVSFTITHEFPVPDRYIPIDDTVNRLKELLNDKTKGYMALVGSPGSGKSTLLTECLRYTNHYRLVRYYCFVPNDNLLYRGEAFNFLRYVVEKLEAVGVPTGTHFLGPSIDDLRDVFRHQLEQIGMQWKERREKTVILIDGLDHIKRECKPRHSLLDEFPGPESLPDGLVILLGTQTYQSIGLPPQIVSELSSNSLEMGRFTRVNIRELASVALGADQLCEDSLDLIEKKSSGHPLALTYILNRIKVSTNEPKLILENLPHFFENIKNEYDLLWNELDSKTQHLLALLSRLRIVPEQDLISSLATEETVVKLVSTAKHYFVQIGERWKFFHNSFRQYILEKTGRNPFGKHDPQKDQRFHIQLSEIIEAKNVSQEFQWELVYHLYHGGRYSEVMEQCTQDKFRTHFLSARRIQFILEDLNLLVLAAVELNEPMCVIRALLSKAELLQRSSLIADVHLPLLLSKVNRVNQGIKQALYDNELQIPREKALKFSSFLADIGFETQGREIFDAAEPLTELRSMALYPRDQELLRTWVEAATKFRSTTKIVEAIDALRFVDYEGKAVAASMQRDEKFKLVLELFDSPNTRDREQGLVGETFDGLWPVIERRRRIKDLLHHERDLTHADIEELSELAIENSSSQRTVTVICFRLLNQGARERSELVFQQNSALLSIELEAIESFKDYLNRFEFYCLKAIFDGPLDPLESAPEPQNQYYLGRVRIERVIIALANLWSRSFCDEEVLLETKLYEIGRAVQLFEDRSTNGLLHEFSGMHEEYPEFLVRQAADQGPDCLRSFSELLAKKWEQDKKYLKWPSSTRRACAVALYRAGETRDQLISRLDTIQPSLQLQSDVEVFIEECEKQCLAWVEAQEMSRAFDCISLILSSAFGLGYKDYQLLEWEKTFSNFLKQCPGSAMKYFEAVTQGIFTASQQSRGSCSNLCAINLLMAVAKYDMALSIRLVEVIVEEQVLSFPDLVQAIIIASFESNTIPIALPETALYSLYLPYIKFLDERILEAFANAVENIDENEASRSILKRFIGSVRINISSNMQDDWLKYTCKSFKDSDLSTYIGTNTGLADVDYSEEALILKDETTPSMKAVLAKELTISDLLRIINQVDKSVSFDWDRLFRLHAKDMSLEHARRFVSILNRIHLREEGFRLLNIINHIGDKEISQKVLLEGLSDSKLYGWSRFYDGGSRIRAYQCLAENNFQIREEALRCFGQDFAQGYQPDFLARDIQDLIQLFFEKIPSEEIWQELYEHFSHLREFQSPTVRVSFMWSEGAAREEDTGGVLVHLFFLALNLGFPELREESFRGLVDIYANIPSLREVINNKLNEFIKKNTDSLILGLSLIHQIESKVVGAKVVGRDEIRPHLSHDDMAVRLAALQVMGKSILDIDRSCFLPLPAMYQLDITGRLEKSDLSGDPGEVLPDTEDPFQVVGVARLALNEIHRITGLPIENLVVRTASLMKEVIPFDQWSSEAERILWERAGTLKVETSYRRPRALAAFLAFGQVVTELFMASVLDKEDILMLESALSPIDSLLAAEKPEDQNLSAYSSTIESDSFKNGNSIWLDDFSNNISSPPLLDDGSVVIGCWTVTDMTSWARPQEAMSAGITTSNLKSDFDRPFVTSRWWKASQYPRLAVESLSSDYLVIGGLPQRAEVGRSEWIAFSPFYAEKLEWRLGENGLLEWHNEQGETMVKSRWWRTGRVGRYPPGNAIGAEGWVVVASASGFKKIQELGLPLVWNSKITKSYKEDNMRKRNENLISKEL